MDTACPSPLPAAVRARLWLAAADLVARDDVFLWLHFADRRVLAFRLPAALSGNDDLIPLLANAVAADLYGTLLEIDLGGRGSAHLLYAAPAAPMPLCAYGHPAHAAARAFAAGLDQAALQLLASLDAHRYWSSVRNYNRLAALPGESSVRRMQAVARFPLLAAPIVLTAHHFPNLDGGKRHAWRNHNKAVIHAVEHGRDLTRALAAYYGISKSLVRAPVCSEMWGDTGIAHTRILHLLDGIPAHRRPAARGEIERAVPYLPALERLAGHATAELGRNAFKPGWNTVWDTCEARFAPLAHALDDTCDFLRAAITHINPSLPQPLSSTLLARAWISARGLVSLLEASRRWHRLPRQALGNSDTTLVRLLGSVSGTHLGARELRTYDDLAREGSDMHHCVADYWEDCIEYGTRIFALVRSGERATAEYTCTELGSSDLIYRLAQLRGPCNVEVSPAMIRLARALEVLLNRPARRTARQAIRSQMDSGDPHHARAPALAPLDPESERQLVQVLARLLPQPAYRRDPTEILRAHVAGYSYHSGPAMESALAPDTPLDLVREPFSPHDAFAVRIVWQGHLLGYVPRPANAAIAQRLDAGESLACRIHHLDHTAEPWKRLQFIVADQVLIG